MTIQSSSILLTIKDLISWTHNMHTPYIEIVRFCALSSTLNQLSSHRVHFISIEGHRGNMVRYSRYAGASNFMQLLQAWVNITCDCIIWLHDNSKLLFYKWRSISTTYRHKFILKRTQSKYFWLNLLIWEDTFTHHLPKCQNISRTLNQFKWIS